MINISYEIDANTNLSDLISTLHDSSISPELAAPISMVMAFIGIVLAFRMLGSLSIASGIVALGLIFGAVFLVAEANEGRPEIYATICKSAAQALVAETDMKQAFDRYSHFQSAKCEDTLITIAAMKAPEERRQAIRELMTSNKPS